MSDWIYQGKKFVTHHIPCGVFFGITSVIGPGCVIDVKKLLAEIEELESEGIEIESGELTLEPQNKINIAGNDAISLLKLLDLLEENEDIQKVYSNFEIDDDELEKISSEI